MILQSLRERLVLVLLALLPFHALFVTVLTKMIAGPGHAPMPLLAIWKEVLLLVILGVACVEMIRSSKKWSVVSGPHFTKASRGRQWLASSLDIFDRIIITLIFISFVLLITHHQSLTTFVFGFKYDLLPLLAFFILRRIPWSDQFQKSLTTILIVVGCIIAAYGIIAEFLPLKFFVWLGYSDLHSLYSANGPLAAFQQLEGGMMRRAQSVMSGPNQLGLWLLIPLGILLGEKDIGGAVSGKRLAGSTLLLIALLLTFSRAAWIAAAVMVSFAFIRSAGTPYRRKIFATVLGLFACLALAVAFLLPSVFFRINSSSDHIRKPVEAMRMMMTHPLGLGLGTAGPASNRFSDTCVHLPKDADFSWAKDRQDLCVFVDSVQVQPSDRVCSCPLLTENWYLQIGVELGLIGLVLYVVLMILVLKRLALSTFRYLLLVFLGLSIAALFLHAFEDSAVAYSVWVLLAVAFATLDVCQHKSSRSQVRS